MQLERDHKGAGCFKQLSQFEHPYPATKVMWAPSTYNEPNDLLATTGDYLRVWSVGSDSQVELKALLNNNRHTGIVLFDVL
jgi:WD repeat-containing protein 68